MLKIEEIKHTTQKLRENNKFQHNFAKRKVGKKYADSPYSYHNFLHFRVQKRLQRLQKRGLDLIILKQSEN